MVNKLTQGVLVISLIIFSGLVYLFFGAGAFMLIVFLSMLVAIAKSKYDRALIAMIAGIITFFVVFFTFVVVPEASADPNVNADAYAYSIFVKGLVGSPEDGFTNLRSLLLVAGMMIIIQVCVMGGLFQVFAFSLIKLTKGNGSALLVVFCFLAVFTTAVFNDILTIILLVPLTIEVCRILGINPKIYVILEAVTVKIGATFFSISSISNILISGYFSVAFSEFFMNIGIYSMITFVVTIFFHLGTHGTKLESAQVGVDILLEYKVSSFIPDKKLLAKCIIVLVSVLTMFTLNIPNFPADVVTITAAGLLLFLSQVDMKDLVQRVDFKLIIYLFGIFIVSGGMEATGLIELIKDAVQQINISDPVVLVTFALLISAGLSAFIDNIPIVRILLPIIASLIPEGTTTYPMRMAVICMLVFGVNIGDNLTPFGDTLMTFNVAEQHDLHMKPADFFNVAFKTTIFQYATLLAIFYLQINLTFGLWFLLAYVVGLVVMIKVFKMRMPFTFKNAMLFIRSFFKRRKE